MEWTGWPNGDGVSLNGYLGTTQLHGYMVGHSKKFCLWKKMVLSTNSDNER